MIIIWQPRRKPRLFCELGKERVVEGANPYRRTVFAFDLFCIGLRNPIFQPVGGDCRNPRNKSGYVNRPSVGVGALDDPFGRKELFLSYRSRTCIVAPKTEKRAR